MDFQTATNHYLEITPSFFASKGIIKVGDINKWRKHITKLKHVQASRVYSLGDRVRLSA